MEGSIKRYVANVQNEVASLENENFIENKKEEKKIDNNDTK